MTAGQRRASIFGLTIKCSRTFVARRQENWEGGSDDFRGAGGPLSTQENRYADELIEAYRGAANQAGYPNTPDYTGAPQHGFPRWHWTIRNGRRCSAADAFLRPAMGRPNLEIATGVHATRILFDQTTAKGIEFTRGDRLDQAFGREIILSAGVVNSPQLLMLSGIGDAGTLAGHGIAPLVSLPGVGENLQDHMSVAVTYARRGSGPLHRVMRADRIAVELAKAYAFGRGLAADLPAGVMGFLRTDDAQALPDLQLMFNAAPFTARPYLPPFTAPYADGFASRLACLRPESRGSVTLRSADPMQAPVIRQNFFSARADLVTLRNGIEIAREIARQPALRPYLHSETFPGPEARGDTELEAYIRRTAITVHHPSGTCRMGVPADGGAVVDQHLKVFGIEGLRVIDASVIPNLIGGNINAPTMMIADRAADFLLSDASSDHAHAVGSSHSRSRLFETQVS